MIANNTLERSDLLLIMRPVRGAGQRDRQLARRLRMWGLLGAIIFYASIQIPAWLQYWQPQSVNTMKSIETPVLAESTTNQAENQMATAASNSDERSVLQYENLGIQAPITWQIEYINKEIQRHLENGLVHIKGSAEPGQQGTVIITGHSSNFIWAKGDYKTVFAPLLKANIGDTITIKHRGKLYSYQVKEVYEVEPTQVDLMNAKSGVDLRLITCTPLGSSKRRLIVDAMQTSPDRTQNTTFEGGMIQTETLPTAR